MKSTIEEHDRPGASNHAKVPLADAFGWTSLALVVIGLVVMVIEGQAGKHGLALVFWTSAWLLKHAEVHVLRKERKSAS